MTIYLGISDLEEPGQFDLFKVIITTKVGYVDIKSMVESFNYTNLYSKHSLQAI